MITATCALDNELTEVGATELIILPFLEVEAVALVIPAEPSEESAFGGKSLLHYYHA